MIDRPTEEWLRFLDESYDALVSSSPLHFGDLTPSRVPEAPGVYIITAEINGTEKPYYIGRSTNLRQRLYNNHLMGPRSNARLKKYLVDFGECSDMKSAKNFIRQNCLARWIEESDTRKRGAIEDYTTGLLFPKYGIYKEH
jgi:predicted GIY-YIG superfamily endonuclease